MKKEKNKVNKKALIAVLTSIRLILDEFCNKCKIISDCDCCKLNQFEKWLRGEK